MPKWKVIKKEIAFKNKWRSISDWTMQRPDKKLGHYYFVDDYYVVMVFPLAKDGNVIVNHHYYIHANKRVFELPAGYIEFGTPLATAKRELIEETGYTSKKWIKLGSYYLGKWTIGKVHYFLALDAEKTHEQSLEPGEDIIVKKIPLEKFKKMLRTNKIATTLAHGLGYEALDYLGKL